MFLSLEIWISLKTVCNDRRECPATIQCVWKDCELQGRSKSVFDDVRNGELCSAAMAKTSAVSRCVTNWLTPWSRVLLEKLIVTLLVKTIPTTYGTRKYITVLTRASQFQSKGKSPPCAPPNWAPRHEGVLGEWRYSSTHSLTSALDGDDWSALRPEWNANGTWCFQHGMVIGSQFQGPV
jgi:hypothetical protein